MGNSNATVTRRVRSGYKDSLVYIMYVFMLTWNPFLTKHAVYPYTSSEQQATRTQTSTKGKAKGIKRFYACKHGRVVLLCSGYKTRKNHSSFMETWPCGDCSGDNQPINESQAAGNSLQVTVSCPTSLLRNKSELVWDRKFRENTPLHTGARKKQPTCLTNQKGVWCRELEVCRCWV